MRIAPRTICLLAGIVILVLLLLVATFVPAYQVTRHHSSIVFPEYSRSSHQLEYFESASSIGLEYLQIETSGA